jgi:D-alanyl-D-alanine dipeptidase
MHKLLFFLCCLFFLQTSAQKLTPNPYGLDIVSSWPAYLDSCKKNDNNRLVEIKKTVPGILLDIKYATKDNFMKQVMYKQARAFARKPVVAQLKKIQAALKVKGYGLKIFDAYRPYQVTVAFYQKASDKNFVANPRKGSKHNRGCAVDLTLVYLKTGKEVPMPTPYDSFAPQASANFAQLPAEVIRNRDFLIETMQRYGFRVIANEWWHFDFIGWPNYSLMDIPFEKL